MERCYTCNRVRPRGRTGGFIVIHGHWLRTGKRHVVIMCPGCELERGIFEGFPVKLRHSWHDMMHVDRIAKLRLSAEENPHNDLYDAPHAN